MANNIITRFIGLLGRKKIEKGEGLLLTPCNSIHMMFMKFPIDVVFLDKNNKVVHLIKNIKPWKISPVIFKAKSVLELPSGTIEENVINIDDVLEIN